MKQSLIKHAFRTCVFAGALALPSISTSAATIEPGAWIGTKQDPISMAAVDEAVRLIRAYGYRCDSVHRMTKFVWSRGFTVFCNKGLYHFEISDKGGRWVVEYKD